jgi:hypothetical protein
MYKGNMMNEIFQLSNLLVMPWWALMIIAPRWHYTTRIMASSLIFVPIALVYSVLVLPNFVALLPELANPQLEGIRTLLSTPNGATVAWIHFLAFDLFVGRWIYRDSHTLALPRWIQSTCLLATFMAGPFGWLLYIVIRRIKTGAFTLSNE